MYEAVVVGGLRHVSKPDRNWICVCVFYFTQRGPKIIYVEHSSQQQTERRYRDLSALMFNIWHVCHLVSIKVHVSTCHTAKFTDSRRRDVLT